jgi:hypothetical protein
MNGKSITIYVCDYNAGEMIIQAQNVQGRNLSILFRSVNVRKIPVFDDNGRIAM